jgi:hypothetical protein
MFAGTMSDRKKEIDLIHLIPVMTSALRIIFCAKLRKSSGMSSKPSTMLVVSMGKVMKRIRHVSL